MRSSIDIGSNSVLLLALDHEGQEVLNESRVTALGKGLDESGLFSESSMKATEKALAEYYHLLKENGFSVQNTIVTATEASRVAKNSKEFFKRSSKEFGFSFHIISSEGEAYYSALGVSDTLDDAIDEFVALDIGGASTEFIDIKCGPFKVQRSLSLPFGAVRVSDWQNSKELDEKLSLIESQYREEIRCYHNRPVVGLAGTVTSLAGMLIGLESFSAKEIESYSFDRESLSSLYESIRDMTADELEKKYPFLGKRSQTIVGGAKVLLKCFDYLSPSSFKVSSKGLRYGTVKIQSLEPKFIVDTIKEQ